MKLYFELSICNYKHFLGVFSTADDTKLVLYWLMMLHWFHISPTLVIYWPYSGPMVVLKWSFIVPIVILHCFHIALNVTWI